MIIYACLTLGALAAAFELLRIERTYNHAIGSAQSVAALDAARRRYDNAVKEWAAFVGVIGCIIIVGGVVLQ